MWNRFLSTRQITLDFMSVFFGEVDCILDGQKDILFQSAAGKDIGIWFDQPSTRTELSFKRAIRQLGGNYIDINPETLSINKGESIEDTFEMLNNYVDALVIRSFDAKIFDKAKALRKPIINAGNGNDEHPTQSLIDLYTIWKHFGEYEPLNYLICGNTSRTIRSLCFALRNKGSHVSFVVNPGEKIDQDILRHFEQCGIQCEMVYSIYDIDNIHVLYANRDQGTAEHNRIYPDLLDNGSLSKDAILLHPLPRVYEIHPSCDSHPKAKYFLQAEYAVPVRMALLGLILGL